MLFLVHHVHVVHVQYSLITRYLLDFAVAHLLTVVGVKEPKIFLEFPLLRL